ncbi:hypothetical protein BF95_11780 [Sphingobium sp. Ant17]|nr:hypothetical protein BF95_11780 [Sphingobium sp. Ant17]
MRFPPLRWPTPLLHRLLWSQYLRWHLLNWRVGLLRSICSTRLMPSLRQHLLNLMPELRWSLLTRLVPLPWMPIHWRWMPIGSPDYEMSLRRF